MRQGRAVPTFSALEEVLQTHEVDVHEPPSVPRGTPEWRPGCRVCTWGDEVSTGADCDVPMRAAVLPATRRDL